MNIELHRPDRDKLIGTGKHLRLFRDLAKSATQGTGKVAWVKEQNLDWYEMYQDGRLVPERSRLRGAA